jgi:hypothetical protein
MNLFHLGNRSRCTAAKNHHFTESDLFHRPGRRDIFPHAQVPLQFGFSIGALFRYIFFMFTIMLVGGDDYDQRVRFGRQLGMGFQLRAYFR